MRSRFRKLSFIILSILPFLFSCTSINNKINIVERERENLTKEIRVAVFPFQDAPGPDGAGSGVAFADALTGELVQIGNWQIIERSQLEKIIKEKSLNMSGMTDADYTKVASIYKVDYIIVGSVSQFEYERSCTNVFVPKTKISFKGRIINAETGVIAGTINYTKETGKYALLGCCILGFYYVPVALLTESNKFEELDKVADEVADDIAGDVDKNHHGCLSH